jgi:hypothetical protein
LPPFVFGLERSEAGLHGSEKRAEIRILASADRVGEIFGRVDVSELREKGGLARIRGFEETAK